MNEQGNLALSQYVGRLINRDVFSDKGLLLMSAYTPITPENARILDKYNIVITHIDLVDEFEHTESINEAVEQSMELFHEVRDKKKVPLGELRRNVIPLLLEVSHDTNMIRLFASLHSMDDYTYRHNIAVGVVSSLIGNWMELEQQELLQLTTAALLHDVGKMLIPQHILNKPGKLTSEEYEVMKSHTVHGYEILKKTVGVNHRQALVALQHHERMDGSGYPFGITEHKIDLFSRIVSVADIFHAMTSKRVYRNPSPFYEVLYQMEHDMFGVLDPFVTKLFIEKTMSSLIGNSVLLTDGRTGIIQLIHSNDPTHPLIQVDDYFLDLRSEPLVHIEQIL